MKYEAIKDVTVDGVLYKAGAVITIGHSKVDRLVMLGYLGEYAPQEFENRSVGLDEATAPKKRRKNK